MATIYDVPVNALIEHAAIKLSDNAVIQPPIWAPFVKTGAHKELPPFRKDWWFVRCASILRKVRLLGPVGVSKLCVQYGGKKNRGVKPENFKRGSGAIIRRMLQQLEKAGFVRQTKQGVHVGRIATPAGIEFLDKVASVVYKELGGGKKLVDVNPKPVVSNQLKQKDDDSAKQV